jgi:hypothetical protein
LSWLTILLEPSFNGVKRNIEIARAFQPVRFDSLQDFCQSFAAFFVCRFCGVFNALD